MSELYVHFITKNNVKRKILVTNGNSLPDNLDLGGTFHLALLPHDLVPVEVKEGDNDSWHQVEVFAHPRGLLDALGIVPLIRGTLQN